MPQFLKSRLTKFASGERFPVIVTEDGMPQFYPNTYLTSVLRAKGKQSSTLYGAAEAVKVLRAWELLEGIDLIDRMKVCQFLKDYEADNLVEAMWYKYDYLKELVVKKRDAPKPRRKIKSLAEFRRQEKRFANPTSAQVKRETLAKRIVYIADYIKYLGQYGIRNLTDATTRHLCNEELKRLTSGLQARAPRTFSHNSTVEYQRLGLTYEVEGLLREVIEPGHPLNPWPEPVQRRNSMIIKILLGVGLRCGELLNLRVNDIDFRQNTITIRRLPDNPDDPRTYEPNAKTFARVVRMKDSLAAVIQDYVVNVRRKLPKVRSHEFLVVSSTDGAPLSLRSMGKVFKRVRDKVPGIPVDFSPHVCRHTWNDRFSDFCDKKGIDMERELWLRCKIMGWVNGSLMAVVYTRRSAQEAMNKYLVEMQEYLTDSRLGGLLDEISTEITNL